MKHRKLIVLTVVLSVGIFALVISRLGSDHADEHEDEKSSQVTVWGDRFEIFLEHPFIVANTPTKFVTHVSDLVTLEPRRKGPVTFVLRHGSEVPIEHIEQAPARDGIYIPELTFPQSGQWDVSLVIGLKGKDHIINLPLFEVYGSHEEADRAPLPQEIAGISFLKEQQWEIPTLTEPVRKRKVLDSEGLAVPESTLVDEDGLPMVFVQVAGETFQKRYLETGGRANGFVEVLSGLSEGEYVTTKGAYAVARAEHGEESTVHLSDEQIMKFGIETGPAGPGDIKVHISLPGEITFNANKLAHIVPTVPGIVRQVVKDVGDTVVAGEIIAWLESTKLGGAKVQYLAKQSEVSCCSIELVRAQEVYDNTLKLLATLKSSPSLETLRKMNDSAMGMNRSLLVSSYAEFTFARETYLREKDLYEKKITSKEDFLKAQSAFKKADAQYIATQDSINFEVRRNLLEAKRTQHIREIELKAAEQLLYVLGLTVKDVKDLAVPAKKQNLQSQEEQECNDPNCTECTAESRAKAQVPSVTELRITNEKLAWYPIRTPFDGTIIDKHITLGEVVGDGAEVFIVADLDTVWVDLQVHQKYASLIKKGQEVIISATSSVPETKGVIDYVQPVVDQKTRTALARIVLDNTSGKLRPGTFVTADVLVDKVPAIVAVAKDILQDIDDKICIFVKNEHCFEARPVTVGRSNDKYVEIVSGITPGEKIVTNNSFRLKAELEKTAGGGHAGHAH